MTFTSSTRSDLVLGGTAGLLAGGVVARLADAPTAAAVLWATAGVVGLLVAVSSTVTAVRAGRPSVDVVAVLALVGSLAVGEHLAAAVVAVMLATGRLLEARAAARAGRELSRLVARAPRVARVVRGGEVRPVPVAEVVVGDRLLIGAGEVVPVDARLTASAVLDESALTGEPLPVTRAAGEEARSGVVNAGSPVEAVATRTSERSTYAGLVRLVEQAQAASAPLVRTADRIAVVFVPVALLLAGAAWLVSGDPVRAVAVLVVATPCPLLLAAPIAVMSGLSRAAGHGVVVKGGAALERLATASTVFFDKTGTLTRGRPVLAGVESASELDEAAATEALRLAASLDQVSPHVLAGAVVSAATSRGLRLSMPTGAEEVHGQGLLGVVDGREVRVGRSSWVVEGPAPAWVRLALKRAELDGSLTVTVAVDGGAALVLLLNDPIRPDAARMVRALRQAGVSRVVLLTGDREDTARTVGRLVGLDEVLAGCTPAAKLEAIRSAQGLGSTGAGTRPGGRTRTGRRNRPGATVMVGDGVNDAPALAAADVGVALAARGATASSEAADVVLTVDRVDALADAVLVARRSRAAALQAAGVGMGLSAVAMLAAAAGFLAPAAGALLQEGIDVLAIGIALRALLPGRVHTVRLGPVDEETARRLHREHVLVQEVVEQVRATADSLAGAPSDVDRVSALVQRLEGELVPHERAEEAELLPVLTRALGTPLAGVGLSRTHAEIEQQVARLSRLLAQLVATDLADSDVVELRRSLYGLYGVLLLHQAQEDEDVFSLVPER